MAQSTDTKVNEFIINTTTEELLKTQTIQPNQIYVTPDDISSGSGGVANYVDLSSSQTITGQKTFTQELIKSQSSGYAGYAISNTGYTRGNIPTNTIGLGRWIVRDSGNQYLSYLQTQVNSNGSVVTELLSRQATTAGGSIYQEASIGLNTSRTDKFVYVGGRLQPRTNNTYDLGTKDFRWRNAYLQKIYTYETPIIKANSIDLTENPTTTQYKFVDFIDGNDTRIGVIGVQHSSTGKYGVYLQAGNFATMGIRGTSASDVEAWAPTPPSGDNSTKIATTAWVNDKINAVNESISNLLNSKLSTIGGETGTSFVLSSNGNNFYVHTTEGTVIGTSNETMILRGSSSNPMYIGGNNNLQNIVLEKDLTDLKEFDWQYVTTYILNQTSDAYWSVIPNFDFENYDYYFESTLILENGGFNGLMFTDANSNVLTFNVRWVRIATEGGSGSGSSTQWAGYQAVREDNIIYGVDTMSGTNRFIRETIKLSRQANTGDAGPNIDFEFNSWASYAGNQRNYMVRGYVYPTDTTNTLSIKGISRFVSEGTTGYLPNSFMRMYRRKRRNETD